MTQVANILQKNKLNQTKFDIFSLGAIQLCKSKDSDSVVESGVCGCVSEFDIAGTGAVCIKAYGGTLCFFLPDPRAHDQSRRQKTALLQAEIRKAVKRSVVAGSSFNKRPNS